MHNQFAIWSYGSIHKYEPACEYFNFNNENWILMQFTWLKDKNWKDLYEGDILNDGEINYEVIYFWDRFMLKLAMMQALSSNLKLMNLAIHYEIVWNIYENPDLLK